MGFDKSSGFSTLENHVGILMSIASFISLLCALLFLVGVTGYTTNANTLQSVSWASISVSFQSVKTTENFGLQGYFSSVTSAGQSVSNFVLFSDCTTSSIISISSPTTDDASTNLCPSCSAAGQAAFGLTLASFFLAGIICACSVVRACLSNGDIIKILSVFTSCLAITLSAAAFGNWRMQCFSVIQKGAINHIPSGASSNVTSSIGFNAVVVAFVFQVIVMVIHLITPSGSSKEENPEATLPQVYSPSKAERSSAQSFHLGTNNKEDMW